MSHYAEYMKEAFGREVYEDESGFIVFFKLPELPNVCYIIDIYVAPTFRKLGTTARLEGIAIKWAIENGCDKLLGSVNVKLTTPERSMVELVKAGYKYSHAAGDFLFFVKNIQGAL